MRGKQIKITVKKFINFYTKKGFTKTFIIFLKKKRYYNFGVVIKNAFTSLKL